jgi:hypothetical protein
MFANHPATAKRWAKHTPKGADLPERVKEGSFMNFDEAFRDEISKIARKMPHFTEQDRPEGVKDVYRALAHRSDKKADMRERYGKNWKEVAARIAARQGKPGKQKVGAPYSGPLAAKE